MTSVAFAQNLQLLINEQQISQAELSRCTGIAQPIINGFVRGKGKNPTLESLKAIADYFVVNISQLIGEEPLPKKRIQGKRSASAFGRSQIPVVDWSRCLLKDRAVPTQKCELITIDIPNATGIFGLKMKGSAMEPLFPEGTTLIFNPDKDPEDGDYCLLQLSNRKLPTFKQIYFDGGQMFCQSLNPDFSDFKALNNRDKIIATLVQARHEFV